VDGNLKAEKSSQMHPNFILRQLVDRVRPDENEMQTIAAHVPLLERSLATKFPGVRLIPIGSHRRGTAIAVRTNVDYVALLPPEWSTWVIVLCPP
jgi:hypothetical protein